MKKRLLYTAILLSLIIAAALYLRPKAKSEDNAKTVTQSHTSEGNSQAVTPVEEPDTHEQVLSKADPIEEQADEEISAEVIATRSMVMAHEPLREPSVADPDSQENKAILQAMVMNALDNETAPKN